VASFAAADLGVESGKRQNDTLRKLPLGVPVEPIGFFHQQALVFVEPKFVLSRHSIK
jgi:uncharacterized protein (DUF2141 family)